MQVSIEKISNTERRLTIVVPQQQVEDAYQKQISTIAKRARIDGFRPGKAPLSYIQKRFGNDARAQALNEIIQESFVKALSENNLRPINEPTFEPKMMSPNQPLEFMASFEVLPELTSINFALASIEKLQVTIEERDIDRVLQQLIKQYTKWQTIDQPAEQNQRVVIDYEMITDGDAKASNQQQNIAVDLNGKNPIVGFEAGLLGIKADEERRLQLQFPADFQEADKAGKPVEFIVKAKQILTAQVPELDETFIKQLGISSGNLDDLKQQIKQTLEQERDRLIKEKMKEQIFNALLEQNQVAVPQSLINKESKKIHDEIYQHRHHDHGTHTTAELNTFADLAKKRVTLGILIAEYAKQKAIKVDIQRVQKRINEIASVYEKPEEVIQYLQNRETRSGIEAQIMEDQVLESLIDSIPVTEKVMSYAELTGTST